MKYIKIEKCSVGLLFARKHVSVFHYDHINKFGNL